MQWSLIHIFHLIWIKLLSYYALGTLNCTLETHSNIPEKVQII